jgi:acyl carrier protein
VLDARAGAGEEILAVRARDWVAERLTTAKQAIANVVAGATAEPLAAEEIEAAVAGFARDIGDHEQHRPGAVQQLDPLLQRDCPAADVNAAIPATSERRMSARSTASPAAVPSAVVEAGFADHTAVEDWLQQWIAARSQLDVAGIDKRRPFVEFGLDSIAAVELADQLSRFVGMEVPSTSTWDHPTIEALAAAIAQRLTVGWFDQQPTDNRKRPDRAPFAAVDLGRMSEQELVALLSREVDDIDDERS